ncbi:MAG: hypothetical protein JJU31_01645 [Wenzhouxiangella sp.]|nr:hypothetical protein [Wenzhouxiangella sp.]MCH8478147.1 hypothetical protein [Wenzhouxiangella sp.]
MSKVGNEYPCELELWGQSVDAWIIVGDDQTINIRVSASLSARLGRQSTGSERMLGWGFSRVDCNNNRPKGIDMVVCHVATSEGEKQLAVIYRGDTLRVVDIRDVE